MQEKGHNFQIDILLIRTVSMTVDTQRIFFTRNMKLQIMRNTRVFLERSMVSWFEIHYWFQKCIKPRQDLEVVIARLNTMEYQEEHLVAYQI